MPDLSTLDPKDLAYFRAQGYTDAEIQAAPILNQPQQSAQPIGYGTTIADTAKAHAGGILGGGAGSIGGMAASGALLGAMIPGADLTGIPEAAGAIIGGTIGALGGGYAGQKIQQGIEPADVYAAQQQAAQDAATANPKTALATDIIGSALASGGRPSMDALTAGKGLLGKLAGRELTPEAQQALQGTILNSAINPAINSGINYATTGQLPSLKDLASQALGGAVFSRQAEWASRLTGLHGQGAAPDEPEPEVNNQTTQQGQLEGQPDRLQIPDKRRFFGDESGIVDVDSTVTPSDEPEPEVTSSPKLLPFKASPSESGGNLTVSPQILQTVIDKGATQPVSVQRIFPKLNLSDNDAAEVLRQANEMQSQQSGRTDDQVVPAAKTSDILPTKTQPAELAATPLPSVGQDDNATKVSTPNPPITDPLSGKQIVVNSPLSDYNRYQELDRQRDDMVTKAEDPEALMSSEEYVDMSKELEEIKNRNSGMPPERPDLEGSVALAQKIHEGTQDPTKRVTLGQALEFTGNQDSELSEAAKDMVQAGKNNPGLAAPILHDPSLNTKEVGGTYDPNDKTIKLPTSGLTDTHAIIHEGIHALEHPVLPSPPKAMQGKEYLDFLSKFIADPKSNPHAVEMTKAYLESARQAGKFDLLFGENGTAGEGLENGIRTQEAGHEYGYSNVHEFSADKFRPEFKKVLQGQKWGEGQTVWSRIMNSLKKFLGIKSQSMFDRVIETSKKLQGSNVKSKSNFDPEREFYTKKQTGKDKPIPETVHMGKLGGLFRAMTDAAGDIKHPMAKEFGAGAKKTLNEAEQLRGRTTNKIISTAKEYPKLTEAQNDRLNKAMNYELKNKSSGMFLLKTAAERQIFKAVKEAHDYMGKLQEKYNIPVYDRGVPRKIQLNEWHHGISMEPKVVQTLREGTDTAAIEKFHQDFLKNAKDNYGLTPDGAETKWKDLLAHVQGKSSANAPNMQRFAGSRIAQGIPMPESMQRHNFLQNAETYFNRLSLNHAYYHNIESNHKIMGALGETKDAWNKPIEQDPNGSIAGNKAVIKQLAEFHGEHGIGANQDEEAISNLSTGLAIARPGLEVHKIGSNIIGGVASAAHIGQAVDGMLHAITHINQGWEHSVENGRTRMTAKSTLSMFDKNITFAQRLQALSQGVRNVATIGGLTSKFNDGLMQAYFERLMPAKIASANKGNIDQIQFLRKLDPDFVKGKTYSPKEVEQLASLANGYIHGTSDGRTMPHWMAGDSEISGFFKLAHWSVSQTNRFMSDVYTPATRGNLTPLVTSIFGSIVGGYMIKEIREKLQGKKYQLPDLQDIASSYDPATGKGGFKDNKGLLAYNAIAACQYAGFAGILSQLARYPFDLAYKNTPQGAMFPLDEIATDIGSTISDAGTAVANDPNINWLHLTTHVFEHLLKSDFALANDTINQGINNGLITGYPAEKKELSDKLQQLRKFQMVSGLPYNEIDQGSNPYMNIEQKRFKMEQDLPTAMKELPGLVSNIIDTYKGQPDVLMSKLKALKENNYSTFPSMDTAPLSFYKYLGYLNREEGSEAAQKELMSYMQHKVVNEVKSSVVP